MESVFRRNSGASLPYLSRTHDCDYGRLSVARKAVARLFRTDLAAMFGSASDN
jgi:hypothetical protein